MRETNKDYIWEPFWDQMRETIWEQMREPVWEQMREPIREHRETMREPIESIWEESMLENKRKHVIETNKEINEITKQKAYEKNIHDYLLEIIKDYKSTKETSMRHINHDKEK